jgi:predicted RNase H-like nuclease (RuvC/YqgF family)
VGLAPFSTGQCGARNDSTVAPLRYGNRNQRHHACRERSLAMKKSTFYGLVTAVVLLAITSGVLFVQYQKKSNEFVAAKESESDVQKRYGQTIDAIAQIQDSLNAITMNEKGGNMLAQGIRDEQNVSGPNAQNALDRIELLRASIQRSKERIQNLENDLKHSGNRVSGLSKMVAQLKASVAEKEAIVATLTSQVDSLTTEVHGLATNLEETQQTVVARDATIEEKRKENATVFVAVGTKKDLTTSGVVTAKGGVLGMGKTLAPTGTGSEAAFTALDTDQETVVHTQAAKAQVISAQPASSYELVTVNGVVELHILNPDEFRKVKQLVIVTA